MDSFKKTASEVLNELGVNPDNGLDDEEVKTSKAKNGTNSFGEGEKVSLLKRIWDAATEPMLILLIVAAVITIAVNVANYMRGGEYNFIECVGIIVAIVLCVVITVVTEGKSAKAFEELNKINEDTLVKVIRNGEAQYVTQGEIVVGDIMLLETGDKIVADGRLIESHELNVDESTLTGESEHVTKDENFVGDDETQVADRINMVYSGCFVSGGTAKMVVTAVGRKTEFGLIAGELSSVQQSTTPLQEKLDRMGKVIAVLGIIAAIVVLGIQIFQMRDNLNFNTISEAFITSIVLIVAAVPEGLPTIVAVSLALNIIKMTRENALVKKLVACETIGCVNIICSDKTGTLTENKMTVKKFYAEDKLIEPDELRDLMIINNCAINSNANLSQEEGYSFVGNPTECALLVGLKKSGFDYEDIRDNSEELNTFAFSSQKKRMTRIVKMDGKVIAYMKGSPGKILNRCSNVDETKEKELNVLMESFQEQAGRLIAFAHRELDSYNDESEEVVEKDFVFDGFAVISDPVSDDVYDSLAKCRKAGIEVKMLTGDNIVTATAIANELHLLGEDGIAVEAKEIDEMNDEELIEALKKIRVIARSTPMIKMRVVRLLKGVGNVVAVTGDGINDAPAIKHADVGIAMGIAGTEVTKEASDIVLLDDSFTTIVKAVKWGRGIYENFKRFIQFQLTVNVAAVAVIIISIVMNKPSPFTALELLWINIIMDGPPALTLGLEPMRENLFDRKPTKRNENIISKKMFTRIMLNGIFISAVCLVQNFHPEFLGATSKEENATVIFTMFVLFQLFNAFNCRELDTTPMYKNILKNKLMLGVFLLVFAVQFVITQFGKPVFGTEVLSLAMWGKMLLVASSVVVINEIIKLGIRVFKK